MNIFAKIVDLFKTKEVDPKYCRLLRELWALSQPLVIKNGCKKIIINLESYRFYFTQPDERHIRSEEFHIDIESDDDHVIIYGRTGADNIYKIYIIRSSEDYNICHVCYQIGRIGPRKFGKLSLI